MKGQLLKDLINLKQQGKIYLAIILLWGFIAYTNGDPAYFGGLMMMFTLLVPMSALSYDEKAKWDKYALTMPVKREELVAAKYLLAVLTSLAGTLISLILSVVMGEGFLDSLILSGVFVLIGISVVSLILPVMFKFGVEKGRLIMIVIVIVPTIFANVLAKMNVQLPSGFSFTAAGIAAVIICACITIVSFLFSKAIYLKKEF